MIVNAVRGDTRVEDGVGIVTVSSVYATSSQDLWEAITAPDRLRRWFGEVHPRGEGTASYDAALTTGWSGTVVVDECDPPRRIRATLRNDTPDVTIVFAVLQPTTDGTRLIIEERGLPVDDLPSYAAGWHAQLDQLDATLTGGPTVDWRSRWEQLRTTYRSIE